MLSLLFNPLKSQETIKLLESTATCSEEGEYKRLPDGGPQKQTRKLEIPVSAGVYLYQAIGLYHGWRVIASKGDQQGTQWKLHHLILSSVCALLAGIIGGLLGIGGGFVMGPLFLELGIAPQVASATATFGMTFSASISVVQYYLLNRFPVPYALYLTLVAAVAAYIGQFIIDKLVNIFQRASLIIFVLAFTIFVSAIALGGVGISDMIQKIQRNEYMGFEDLCKYDA
ncbi:Transmembrane protein [Sesbania bispinosa]|nr:Transmembrane protein [Sesbania bispinosa]